MDKTLLQSDTPPDQKFAATLTRVILVGQLKPMRTAAFFIAVCATAWNIYAAPVAQAGGNQTLISEQHTNTFKWVPLVPGKDDSRIARVTATFLERGHYLQQEINATISSNFYTRYIDSLDPMHMMFLQSD